MNKKMLPDFAIPFLIAGVISIMILAIDTIRDPLNIALVIIGALLGTILLEIEYFIYAYFLEPQADFSKTLTGFVKHADLINVVKYINFHREEIKDSTLNSIVFQIVLVPIVIFVMYSNATYLIKTLVLTTFAISIYKMLESYFSKGSVEWFWALKKKPSQRGVIIYSAILIITLIFSVSITA